MDVSLLIVLSVSHNAALGMWWHWVETFFTLITSTSWNNVTFATEAMQCVTPALQSPCERRPLGVVTAGSGTLQHALHLHWAPIALGEPRDMVYTITSSQMMNSRFCDTLDVIMGHLEITLRTSFPNSLTAFVSSRHSSWLIWNNLGLGLASEKCLHRICITESI